MYKIDIKGMEKYNNGNKQRHHIYKNEPLYENLENKDSCQKIYISHNQKNKISFVFQLMRIRGPYTGGNDYFIKD
jgi:hypothetical protein